MSYSHQSESTPKFSTTDQIQVVARHSEGHCRTPSYIRGKAGIIERYCGNFKNPEQLAVAHPAPEIIPLYRCRFLQKEVWPNYSGTETDTLEIEIYEHWLDPV
jgi:nitrile hydratase subunit beta